MSYGFGGGGSSWSGLGTAIRHEQNLAEEERRQRGIETNAPWAPYYDPATGWYPDANNDWSRDHSIDPNTGEVRGPYPLPPADVALGFQAQHDRAVWNRRNRLMRDALAFGRGGLSLMQSYRPGGSAAIQAGTHMSLAQIQLNRAAMTTPLDLLGDYRRHEAAKAGSAADKETTANWIVGGLAAVAAFYTGGATAGLAADKLGKAGKASFGDNSPEAAEAAGFERAPSSGSGGDLMGLSYGGQSGSSSGSQGGQGAPGFGMDMGGGGTSGFGTAGAGYAPDQPQGGGGAPGGAPAGPGGRPGGGQPGGGQGGAGAAGAAGPMPGIGADGNYTQDALAAHAAQRQMSPIEDAVLLEVAADRYDSDPFYQALNSAIDYQMSLRLAS